MGKTLTKVKRQCVSNRVTPFMIKEVLSDGQAYTVKDLCERFNCPVTTMKRVIKLVPGIHSGHLDPTAIGCPLMYWLSPSHYDDIDEPMTKMDILKDMLLHGEKVSYLTFGNKQDGDAVIYSYIQRLINQGWKIVKQKENGRKTLFYLDCSGNPKTIE